jgi:acetoin utilization protein AcuC
LGWLDAEAYIDSPRATPEQLSRFHDQDYIAALQRAEAEQHIAPEVSRRFNIGCNGNPLFREMFSRPATACGGSLLAAGMLLEAGEGAIIYNPGGGTHHGRRDRASGFCYLNDPVLAMLRLLDGGMRRIWYVDLDAHHCDGVQDAFADDDRVVVLSVHEAGRWPFTGAAEETGCGNVFNLPVPPGFNDAEMALLLDEVILPLGRELAPEVVVVQCGADALADDPLSKLALSNGAIWRALAAIKGLAPRLLVLGGGGYNPWSVARCWAGTWAVLAGRAVPETLPPEAEAVLRDLSWSRSAGRNPPRHWFTTLEDKPNPGSISDAVALLACRMKARRRTLSAISAEAV